MVEVNGLKYSSNSFDEYEYSAVIVLEKDKEYCKKTVYTTDSNRCNLIKVLENYIKNGVRIVRIDSWSTKEQDELESEYLLGWLKEL